MKQIAFISFAALLASATLATAGGADAGEPSKVDLTKWAAPDIASVGNDPFGKLVKYGYALISDTANQIGPTAADPARRFAGNNLNCQSCHLDAGTRPYAMPLTGIWGQFPQYRGREGAVDTLEVRINGCMERSMNGHALASDSREMLAMLAYMRWLSGGIPAGATLIGAGTLRIKEPPRAADPARGAQVYADTCAACHGADGSGQRAASGAGYQIPPLWGPDSFNDGAGMTRVLTAAAYAKHNMPFGTTFDAPVLSDDDAYDVAGYITSQDRPHKANLENDFPIRLEKPVDTPYGPYADGFSAAQHKLGPFAPIRARVQELAKATTTRKAGGPDNGSFEAEAVK
ncbi:MAG: c-type cytochrome [Xanthobacteraceae bacterium]|nr:c-type cytochrome [Xanthobacteraceae bacterium]MBV9632290.1 c-type cytochrome [Xanthobacteraceae bacterium]